MRTFIDEREIENLLDSHRNPDPNNAREVIEKSNGLNGLCPEDVAVLLDCQDKDVIEYLFETARSIKEEIYGNRLVLFAPLYLSNICVNNCLYCGFRSDNKDLRRRCLDMEEIKREVEILESEGHKRLLLVSGEANGASDLPYIEEAIKTVYLTRHASGSIRRVNVNIAPLTIDGFKRLKEAGIGTYQLFQETYHRASYKKMHPSGPKSDYQWRLYTMDRAYRAGIDDVGIGVLFGLYDYRFEVIALLSHCLHLEKEFGVGPHTISIPRVKPAMNAPLANTIPYPVSDEDFKKLVAIIRLAVPYAGMILSTREPAPLRDEIFGLGISQISAGSRTNPGAYSEHRGHAPESEQFYIEDTRTQLEVIKDILKEGFFPSFCTACYRAGRTGRDFMVLAKPGDIKNFCLPNCILTFKEYVLDYGDKMLQEEAGGIIQRELNEMTDGFVKEKTVVKIKRLEEGERDLYF